jgi:serine/threonine protein kinase
MAFMEEKKFIHGNLRASNILLCDDDVVKIGGLSLARHIEDGVSLELGDGEELLYFYNLQ